MRHGTEYSERPIRGVAAAMHAGHDGRHSSTVIRLLFAVLRSHLIAHVFMNLRVPSARGRTKLISYEGYGNRVYARHCEYNQSYNGSLQLHVPNL
jgi:hypothetical protein